MGKGLEKLQTAVEKDCSKDGGTLHPEGCVTCGAKCFHKYCDKYKWVIDRAKSVRVFDTMDAYRKALDGKKFRCPSCGKESADPYNCKACGWAVYELLGDLGKGVFVYVKEKLHGDNIFMPIAWEEKD